MKNNQQIEQEINIILVGNEETGKTSIIKKFCEYSFYSEYKKTIGKK
jgi:GTPase SAR1 family protein